MTEPLQWESPREILTGVLITSCIFAAAVFIPVIGFLGVIFIPLPILFYRMKLGRQAGITIGMASVAVMALVLNALGGLSIDILFFSELLLLGYALSEMFEKKASLEKTMVYACAVALGSAFAAILGYSLLTQAGLFELVSNYVSQNLKLTLSIYESMGISPETLAALEASLDRIQYTLVRIIPGLAAAMLLIVAWSNLLIAKPLFKRQQIEYPDFGNLKNWRSPETLIWGLIASGLLVLLPTDAMRLIGINGLILIFTIYFFQGVAIVAFICEKRGLPRFVRIFIYSMIALQQILLLLVVALGIFDMWFEFRKKNKPES